MKSKVYTIFSYLLYFKLYIIPLFISINPINIKNLKPLKYEVKRNFSDITKAKKMMNFEPKVLLEDGLKKTIEYYIKIYKK